MLLPTCTLNRVCSPSWRGRVMRVVLTASAGGFEITLDADNRMHAVAEVHQLLERAGIFISSEGADL
jgi:hypothetical protein